MFKSIFKYKCDIYINDDGEYYICKSKMLNIYMFFFYLVLSLHCAYFKISTSSIEKKKKTSLVVLQFFFVSNYVKLKARC